MRENRRNKRKLKKRTQAYLYVVWGSVVMILLGAFGIYMYGSSTFLPGVFFSAMWVVRKIIYILIAFAMYGCAWFIDEGTSYLKRH